MTTFAETYRDDGCVLVKNFFDREECAWLAETVEPLHAAWLLEAGPSVEQEMLVNSHSLTHRRFFREPVRRLDLFNFLGSDKIVAAIEELLGGASYFLNTQLFFNPSGYRKNGYWHRDTQYLGKPEEEQKALISKELLLHLHIPLLVDPIFEYVPGSHRRWDTPVEREVRLELNGRKNSEAMPGGRPYPAEPGDAIFFSVHGIHRGRSYEEFPRRRTFDVIYGKKHEGAAAFDPGCLPDAEELGAIKNKGLYRA